VIDGDTVQVRLDGGPVTIRLHGIDTPERGQPFSNAATKALRTLVEGEPLQLETIEQTDGYGRPVAKLLVRGVDINGRMVESGFAWAYRRYLRRDPLDERYCRLEAEARASGRGVWAGPPESWRPPWEARARKRGQDPAPVSYAGETTERCIAAIGRSRPGAARAPAGGEPAIGAACRIKGNINSRGERIYHVPAAGSYAGTRIDPDRGERWFCTVAEAESAGWRAPRE
jgi:endonuclease YncB( thermonuclease family)